MQELAEERKRQAERIRRREAWEMLRTTRNADYVALRFDYPVEKMRAALEKIPHVKTPDFVRSASAERAFHNAKPIGDLMPETVTRARVPGEDDDLEESP